VARAPVPPEAIVPPVPVDVVPPVAVEPPLPETPPVAANVLLPPTPPVPIAVVPPVPVAPPWPVPPDVLLPSRARLGCELEPQAAVRAATTKPRTAKTFRMEKLLRLKSRRHPIQISVERQSYYKPAPQGAAATHSASALTHPSSSTAAAM
jgi:hypothetical protein